MWPGQSIDSLWGRRLPFKEGDAYLCSNNRRLIYVILMAMKLAV